MPQQTVTTDEFGVMSLNASTGFYEAYVDVPYLKSKRVSITVNGFDTGIERVTAFLAWLNGNHRAFKLALEREIQNYDLVWDDVWDSILGKDWIDAKEGFLAEYLHYMAVEFSFGEIHVWIDTSGLHTDHMVRVTINEAMQVECCEIR